MIVIIFLLQLSVSKYKIDDKMSMITLIMINVCLYTYMFFDVIKLHNDTIVYYF